MRTVINIAVVFLASLSIATAFSIVYYIVFGLIFRGKQIAESMGHVVASGTIIIAASAFVLSVYTQKQQAQSYAAGYSDAVNDVKTVAMQLIPERLGLISFWDYIERYCENEDDVERFIYKIEEYVFQTDTFYHFITDSSPEDVQSVAFNVRN